MKKIILLFVALAMCVTISSTFAKKLILVKAKAFREYFPTDSFTSVRVYRYDKLDRLVLYFEAFNDNSVDVIMYSYDPVGNMTECKNLSFQRDSHWYHKNRYHITNFKLRKNEYREDNALTKGQEFRKTSQQQTKEDIKTIVALIHSK